MPELKKTNCKASTEAYKHTILLGSSENLWRLKLYMKKSNFAFCLQTAKVESIGCTLYVMQLFFLSSLISERVRESQGAYICRFHLNKV